MLRRHRVGAWIKNMQPLVRGACTRGRSESAAVAYRREGHVAIHAAFHVAA